jgi:hypothetical protein
MCAVLHLADRDVENLGELRGVMRKLVRDRSYEEIPKGANWCLCSVDLEATGRANGLRVVKECYGHYRVTGRSDRE